MTMRRIRICLLVALMAGSILVHAATLHVPEDYTTVQAAIDAAASGDTVFIAAGEYTENLTISKPISVVGEQRSLVRIYASDQTESAIEITVNNGGAIIESISVLGGSTCVWIEVQGDARITLRDTVCAYGNIGIYAIGTGQVALQESLVLETGELGIFAGVRAMSVDRSEICGGSAGIALAGDTAFSLSNSSVFQLDYAIDTFTRGCGWVHGLADFFGTISGRENCLYGWETDLCPTPTSSIWPPAFVRWKWQADLVIILEHFSAAVEKSQVGELSTALEEAEKGVVASSDPAMAELQALLQATVGDILSDLAMYDGAVEAYEAARSTYFSRSDEIAVAGMTLNIGNTYLSLLELDKAISFYKQTIPTFTRWGMEAEVAMAFVGMGAAYSEQGEYSLAVALFQDAREIYTKLGLDEEIAALENNLGVLYMKMEMYAEALDTFFTAKAFYTARDDAIRVATLDMHIGAAYADLLKYERALDAYESALQAFEQLDMVSEIADVRTNMGCLYQNLALYDHAMQAFQHARDIYVSLNLPVRVAQVDSNLGLLHFDLGHYDEALTRYRQALVVFFDVGMWNDTAGVLSNLGHALAVGGEYGDALDAYEEAILLYQAMGLEIAEALVLRNMGLLCLEADLYSDAVEILSVARSIFAKHELHIEIASSDNNIGVAYLALGKAEDARAVFVEALASLMLEIEEEEEYADGAPPVLWHLHYNYGLSLEEIGEWTQASEAYVSSLSIIESIRGDLTSEEIKMAWQERTRYVYERLVELLYRMGETDVALTVAERCRARSFLDLLAEGPVETLKNVAEEGIRTGVVEVSIIEADLAEMVADLPANTAALEYFVTDTATYLWVVRDGVVRAPIQIPHGRVALMDQVIACRQAIESGDPSADLHLAILYDWLIAPVEDLLPSASENEVPHLVIIPSGPLYYLP
ncbi:MAG: tetratricopeptide repeat protein, partial [Candidatus Atribacteria bacterium]